jgi:hypothetical protein
MSDLRSRLIRIAHSNPEMRPHVLPLVAPTSKQASGGRITLAVITDVTNMNDIGGGNWSVDGTCTVHGDKVSPTTFRFDGFTLSHSDAKGWAAVGGASQDPLRPAIVAAGLADIAPPSAEEASTKPRLEFQVSWGGGNSILLAMIMGPYGAEFPLGAAHQYAAQKLIAELDSIPLKQIIANALKLKGVRSVDGPARPTMKDVRYGDISKKGDNRMVFVKYKYEEGIALQDISGRLRTLTTDLRKAGVRY